MMNRDQFQAGKPLTARDLNDIKSELLRLGKMIAAPPLHVSDDAAGFHFQLDEPESFPIKITGGGTGGKYAWTRQTPTAGGGWANDAQSGTTTADPAYEATLNASVAANTIILRAYRDPVTGELRFERACT